MNAATGMPVFDAREDFARARRAAQVARLAWWLGGRRRPRLPGTQDDGDWLARGASGARVIPLAEIVGTLEPTTCFDADFRPASDLVRARWERIALAHRRGIALPPSDVLQRPDGYYIADGRHRVSVARALGDRDIDARVTLAWNARVRRPSPGGAAHGPRTSPEAADARPAA